MTALELLLQQAQQANAYNPINKPQHIDNNRQKNLYCLPRYLFEAVDFTDFYIIDEPYLPMFIEGENYSLQGTACDGFEMDVKVYKLIKVVDEFNGTKIDSVIVKQVAGEEDIKFTLSKNDCVCHNIPYEKGLQLFPKSLPWKYVKEDVPFDPHNLATTPLSKVDNTVRYVTLKLHGFKDYRDGYIITPSGHIIGEGQFIHSIQVITLEPIIYGNGFVINANRLLKTKIVYPCTATYNHANFISSEDEIFLLIEFKQDKNVLYQHKNSLGIDGCFGIEPKYLENLNPNEIFLIKWDEMGARTIEEYEKNRSEELRLNSCHDVGNCWHELSFLDRTATEPQDPRYIQMFGEWYKV